MCVCVCVVVIPTCEDDLLLHYDFEVDFVDITCHAAVADEYGDGSVKLVDGRGGHVASFEGHGHLEVGTIINDVIVQIVQYSRHVIRAYTYVCACARVCILLCLGVCLHRVARYILVIQLLFISKEASSQWHLGNIYRTFNNVVAYTCGNDFDYRCLSSEHGLPRIT